jgi:AcrR family transcriptional regulator
MTHRAVDVAARRTRVVHAAIDLFAKNTAAGTTMDDVARAAGVASATVYRQFRDFDGLVDACAETAFGIAEVPTPEAAVEQFADLDSVGAKLHRFIEISCHCYERAQLWLTAERRERHLPAFARTVGREQAALRAIVAGLLEPVGVDGVPRSVVTTLVDFPFWQSLRAQGVPTPEIPEIVFALVADELRRSGTPVTHPHEGTPDHGPRRDRGARRTARGR